MDQESHEYGMPLSSLQRGHLTHVLRGRIMLESFRKQLFLIPTGAGTAFWCVMWVKEEAWHSVGVQELPGAAIFRLEGSSVYDLLLYFSLLPLLLRQAKGPQAETNGDPLGPHVISRAVEESTSTFVG